MMRLRRLARDRLGRRGIAAVEFALVMPILLILFIGTIEVITLYRTEAKLNALAANVARMVSVAQTVALASSSAGSSVNGTPSSSSLNDVCQGALLGLAPFPDNGLKIVILSVTEESGPAGLPRTTTAYSSTPTYDVWEADSQASSRTTCSTTAGTTFTAAQAEALANGHGGMLQVPCDNAIIVQAQLTYAGLLGANFLSRPTLTQTAYLRWPYASTTTELTCADCTVSKVATPICISTNTATN